MASIESEFEQSVFGYDELRLLTGWPDVLLEDYFAQKRNVLIVADVEDQIIIDVKVLKSENATQEGKINQLNAKLANLLSFVKKQDQLISLAASKNAQLQAKLSKQQKEINKVKQLGASVWP